MSKFIPGQSGNPSGRPKGALNKTTLATRALLEGEAEVLTRKAIELAKEGNPVALRLCLQRLLPPIRKDRTINFTLPTMEGPQDLFKGIAAILEAVAQGEITPQEGQTLTTILETSLKGAKTMVQEEITTEEGQTLASNLETILKKRAKTI
jgi:hypothetical protein